MISRLSVVNITYLLTYCVALVAGAGRRCTYTVCTDQVIRENPASRGTETSAEVLVGPPLGAGGWSETPVNLLTYLLTYLLEKLNEQKKKKKKKKKKSRRTLSRI